MQHIGVLITWSIYTVEDMGTFLITCFMYLAISHVMYQCVDDV